MDRMLTFEAEPFQDEGEGPWHPTLGPGRRVSRASLGEGETNLTAYHPTLGPGRRVPRSQVLGEDQERELVLTDDRVQVVDTKPVPFRWMCSLELFFPDPDDPSSLLQFVGSGALIGDQHVLTAGHCLYDDVTGSSGTSAIVPVTTVRVSPGRSGASRPFGDSRSSATRVSARWRAARDFRADYGLITLQTPLGARPVASLGGQPLGFWGSSTLGAGTQLVATSAASLAGQAVNISGYPADKPSGTQWRAAGRVVNATPAAASQLVYYDLDTCGGHSGSPVWTLNGSTRSLVAIHTGPCIPGSSDCVAVPGPPCFPGGQRFSSNRGVRISTDVLTDVKIWMGGAVTPPAARPTVRRGSTGPAVVELQTRLNGWVKKSGVSLSALAVDGMFGPRTDAAVRVFQRQKGLVVDGIVGPITWAALLSA